MVTRENVYGKSPLENVFNILSSVPQGHEKALKQALYNAIATLLLVASLGVGFGLFYILEPFVKPLIWALLVGSVLHPLKRTIEVRLTAWMGHLGETSKPLLLAVIMVPVHFIDDVSEFVGQTIRKYFYCIIWLCFGLMMALLIYTYIPNLFVSCLCAMWNFNCDIIWWLLHNMTSSMVRIL